MKPILVTGGAGFVGSRACKALSRAGYLPVTFDNLERGHERAVKWGPLERGDLRNHDDLKRAFARHRPSAVMHFAAYAYVGESMLDAAKYYDNNVGGTAKLLQACAAFGCQNVVSSNPRLWHPQALSDNRGDHAEPGQPLWLHQARGRAHAQGCQAGQVRGTKSYSPTPCRTRHTHNQIASTAAMHTPLQGCQSYSS